MARRRRRITIKNSSLFALIILNLLISSSVAYYHNSHHHYLSNNSQQHHHHHHHVRSNHQQPLSNSNSNNHHHNHNHDSQQSLDNQYRVLPLSQDQNQQEQQYSKQQQVETPEKSFSTAHMCRLLPAHVAKQLKLCKLTSYSLNADDAVSLGTQKGLAECRNQFKTERWNCTHSSGDQHLLTSDLAQSIGNRESGFVHAIAAAGIVHSIATACSVGNLTDCACDKSGMGLIRKREENWTWGGCSKDIRYGMMFAKHFVELLDAVHQHFRLLAGSTSATSSSLTALSMLQSNKQHYQHRRILEKRSLSSKNREPNQLRGRQDQDRYPNSIVQQQQQSFCQRSHNISQTTHIQLIKSLLSKNSLEKHQEFRLAMNMHNNKVGRMAIAKNMAYMCRCHGLSGSCTLKTCWVILPDFQRIGAYLKEKYQASVHLPTAVNVNKLIPMMDRNEISAILSSGSGGDSLRPNSNLIVQFQDQPSNQVTSGGLNIGVELPQHQVEKSSKLAAADANNEPVSVPMPEFSPLVSGQSMETQEAVGAATPVAAAPSPAVAPARISGHLITPSAPIIVSNANLSSGGLNPTNIPAHYNFYERHKQLEKAASLPLVNVGAKVITSSSGIGEEDESIVGEVGETISVNNITPMTQEQYQSLLKDLKLCNNQTTVVAPAATTSTSYLATRDLSQQQVFDSLAVSNQQKHKIGHKHNKHNNNLNNQSNNSNQQHSLSSQHLKSANQHLSQILNSKRDDLIHLHKSPDYCEADIRHGFVGIQSRTCSENPSSPDSCDKLCCGRGYKTRVFKHSFRCDCKFQYCCSIYCSVCDEVTQVTLCN